MRVKCALCKNEKNNKCVVKNASVHTNKDRKCDLYVYDVGKVKTTTPKNKQSVSHPVTGDLSRFTTSASRGE